MFVLKFICGNVEICGKFLIYYYLVFIFLNILRNLRVVIICKFILELLGGLGCVWGLGCMLIM